MRLIILFYMVILLMNSISTEIFNTHRFEGVIHLAAESHVDRSITDPLAFAKTNILGTMVF